MESCRVCMGNSEVVVDLFSDRSLYEYEMTLSDMINEIVDFKVQHDEHPQKICISCSLNAQIAFRFKRCCERSQCQLASQVMSISKFPHSEESLNHIPANNSFEDQAKEKTQLNPVISSNKNKEVDSDDLRDIEDDENEWERHFMDEKKIFTILDDIPKKEPCSTEDDGFYIFQQDTCGTNEVSANCFNSASNDSDFVADIGTDSITPSTKKSSQSLTFAKQIQIPRRKVSQSKKCPFCVRAFNNSANLRSHLLTHTKERSFECDQCDAVFARRDKLSAHKRIHLDERKFKCPQCPRSFITNSALQKHQNVHESDQSRLGTTVNSSLRFKCPDCPRSYAQNSMLLRHLEFHKEEHKFKCEVCAMPFATKCSLQLHSRIHTGERPFKCPSCPKAYFTKSKLDTHLFSHTGERPFKCKDCNTGFVTASNLKRHCNTIHNNIKQ